MTKKHGFTLIEIIIVIVFVSFFSILFFTQKANLDAMNRDEARKTAINTIYYSLEEDFFKQYGFYPESISEANLPTVPPELWFDPSGLNFNNPESSYTYKPANCYQGRCQEYILKSTLEKESAYTKTNRDH